MYNAIEKIQGGKRVKRSLNWTRELNEQLNFLVMKIFVGEKKRKNASQLIVCTTRSNKTTFFAVMYSGRHVHGYSMHHTRLVLIKRSRQVFFSFLIPI